MTDAEWIGFATLLVAISSLFIGIMWQRKESRAQQKTIKLMMDYISIQRDAIASIEKMMIEKNSAYQASQELLKEKQAWDKVIAAAKTIGWLYDRDLI